MERFVALQQIGRREELSLAARFYGQGLPLTVESYLWRQRRERALSSHRCLSLGGGVPSCQDSHVSVGRGSGKAAEIGFLCSNCVPYLLSLCHTLFLISSRFEQGCQKVKV